MIKRLNDFILIIEGFLPVDKCQEYIATYGDKTKPAMVEGEKVHPDRQCGWVGVHPDEYLDLRMAGACNEYHERFGTRVRDFTGYSLIKYDTGQFYKQHIDEFPGKPRLLTISVALNDDFEGGEWAWFDRELVKSFKTGDAVMFPSNFMFPHEITPVTKGTRYALITWFTG